MHNQNISYCLDLGGSTIDMVVFSRENDVEKVVEMGSLESHEFIRSKNSENILEILNAFEITEQVKIQKNLNITGGYSQNFPEEIEIGGERVILHIISEFEAIAKGGMFLSGKNSGLVVSLGTGTAMVSVENMNEAKFYHVRGTGIGGGTVLGLGRALLGIESFSELECISASGNLQNIDISVKDIVGDFSESSSMGMLTPDMTASNFGKFSEKSSSRGDIALAIANLVGQSIASLAVEKAKVYGHTTIILGGKISRFERVVSCIQKTARIFGMEIIVPEYSGFMTAVGGGVRGVKKA